jgi:hypothetical protein
VRGQGETRPPRPPVESFFRVIDQPILRLVSVDLGATAEITNWPRSSTSPRIIWACSKPR